MANVLQVLSVQIEDQTHWHFTEYKEPCHSCHLCEGGDHHWMPVATDGEEMVMACKHCPVWRDITDDEEF